MGWPASNPPSDRGCEIISMPDRICSQRRKMYNLHVPHIPGTWYPTVHSDCLCNELVGLSSRVLGKTPGVSDELSLKVAFDLVRPYLMRRKITPMELDEVPKAYRTGKRRLYERAVQSIKVEGPASSKDARLFSFTKADKFNPLAKWADPRIIQARGRFPRYGVELMTFIKPCEHALYSLKSLRFQRVPPTRLFAKGLNSLSRANLIRKKMEAVEDCVVVGLDMSRFDKHVTTEHLNLEHAAYLLMCNNDPRLAQLLAYQLKSKGCTAGGIKYQLKAKRCSGDANTAIGNCLIMLFVIVALMKVRLQIPQWDAFIDGDDTLLFIPGKYVEKVMNEGAEVFKQFGFIAVFEEPVRELEDVEHCQAKPVCVDGVWKMVRNPMKTLSHLASSYKHYHSPGGLRVLKSTVIGELILSDGIPLVQEYCKSILRALSKVKQSKWVDDDLHLRLMIEGKLKSRVSTSKKIATSTRESFDRAFGLDSETQQNYERSCDRVSMKDLDIGGMEFRDHIWDRTGEAVDTLPYSLF